MTYVMKTKLLRGLRQGACSLLLASTVAAGVPVPFTPAFAQEDGEGGQGQGGQSSGSGQGGPDASSDAKGPKAGSPSGSSGDKPVWAKEDIPEVELGRLSLARSPEKVLDRALANPVPFPCDAATDVSLCMVPKEVILEGQGLDQDRYARAVGNPRSGQIEAAHQSTGWPLPVTLAAQSTGMGGATDQPAACLAT